MPIYISNSPHTSLDSFQNHDIYKIEIKEKNLGDERL